MQIEEMVVECVKGYIIDGDFGIIQGEQWTMVEVEEGVAVFKCLNGWNKGLELELGGKELVKYYKVID